ncbi:rho GTPase-activating protein 100F [Trichonephila clavata]|uniref:Rho GTPase-activating protein 100F n=1 Tax=Trichonephila clavata TaxID=2740835 RepID=A0A8X6F755_TRICU|nr:rho GTPase-activating protein 100F [Trichonephila clavata]
MPAVSESALFGVDLERVLVREDSGYGVPLIVKRCTEEVERRGLDIVGIYRLCGSALRKRLLREDFERNTLMANLSVEHVPDINVVTSLLKDYLRELPEPLLSKSLYDMLVDGLSVCLPDDPDGSAKLMFSILECLPKANLRFIESIVCVSVHCSVIAGSPSSNRQSLRSQQDDASGTSDGFWSGAHVPCRDSHCHSRHSTTHRHYELLGRDVAQQEK